MTDDAASRIALRRSPLEQSFDVFQRAVALACILLGIAYWVRLLGFFEGAEWRFDLMPLHWQATAVPLAVLFPFAAVGLWALASWGPVIWFLCALTETAMYGVFSEAFGAKPWLIAFHGLTALIYTLLRGLIRYGDRRSAD